MRHQDAHGLIMLLLHLQFLSLMETLGSGNHQTILDDFPIPYLVSAPCMAHSTLHIFHLGVLKSPMLLQYFQPANHNRVISTLCHPTYSKLIQDLKTMAVTTPTNLLK